MQLNYDYFIDKFSKIPDDKWFTGGYYDYNDPEKRDALGHCEDHVNRSTEADKLMLLAPKVIDINDDISNTLGIKDRVIKYLIECKKESEKLYE